MNKIILIILIATLSILLHEGVHILQYNQIYDVPIDGIGIKFLDGQLAYTYVTPQFWSPEKTLMEANNHQKEEVVAYVIQFLGIVFLSIGFELKRIKTWII